MTRTVTHAFPGRRDSGSVEIITPPLASAIYWHRHGYPDDSIRWHHHEDIEFHLIRQGPGTMLVGDAMVPFAPPQVTMIGGGIPHMWLSSLETATEFPDRDVFCQVKPVVFERLIDAVPDAAAIGALVQRSRRVILLRGGSAQTAAGLIEGMGGHRGFDRFVDLMQLVQTFICAPRDEWTTLLTHDYAPADGTMGGGDGRINLALDHIARHLTDGTLSLESTAAAIGMAESAFSRYFRRVTGRTFSDFVRRMRISFACRLLASGNAPIASIPLRCGYANLSNFNRRFRQETGMTPSQYRRENRAALGGGGGD